MHSFLCRDESGLPFLELRSPLDETKGLIRVVRRDIHIYIYIETDSSTLRVVQKQTLLCSAKTDTTTPGKLGRAVGFSTRASRAGVGF